MKQIKVSELKVGDVFIDGARYSIVEEADRIVSPHEPICIKVKCIVGPSPTFISMPTSNDEYLLDIDTYVLLCKGTLE